MVVVDTSVWIRYFSGHIGYRPELDHLLGTDQVAAHELIYGELLIGNLGGRSKALARYEHFRHARLIAHNDVVALTLFRKLHGRGIGWIDVHLVASALAEHMQFWTADASLAAVAEELGIAYK